MPDHVRLGAYDAGVDRRRRHDRMIGEYDATVTSVAVDDLTPDLAALYAVSTVNGHGQLSLRHPLVSISGFIDPCGQRPHHSGFAWWV